MEFQLQDDRLLSHNARVLFVSNRQLKRSSWKEFTMEQLDVVFLSLPIDDVW